MVCHSESEGVGSVQGEVEGPDVFSSQRVCWTPAGKLVLRLVGTLRKKTESDALSE